MCAVNRLLINLVGIPFVQKKCILRGGLEALSCGRYSVTELLSENPSSTLRGSSLPHQPGLACCLGRFDRKLHGISSQSCDYNSAAMTLLPTAGKESPAREHSPTQGSLLTLHERGSERSCCLKCVDFAYDFSSTYLSLLPGLTCPCLLEGTRVSRSADCFYWTSFKCLPHYVQQGSQKKKKQNKNDNPPSKPPNPPHVESNWDEDDSIFWTE